MITKKQLKEFRKWHDEALAERAKDVKESMAEFVELVRQQQENRSWMHKLMDKLTGWDSM
jgi:hypothetical protein